LGPLVAQMSGINLLQYKSGRGVIGQTCYGRYLREAYKLISKYGGGLYYFGEVRGCASPADGTTRCAIAECKWHGRAGRCKCATLSRCACDESAIQMLMKYSIHAAGRG
jgi:hypothetical protein